MKPAPFRKLLVANRGEIACRIMRTASAMGIRTVAVYSDADVDSAHVAFADEAYRLGPAPASQSYLDISRIVDVCRTANVDAVHPGYGFLSERREFAQALVDAGISFIGPNPAAIAAMGDKITSKRIAAEAGISVVPGFLGIIEGPDHAVMIAETIGYPVMIKASAGGGGKGMRVAASAAEVAENIERARSEAVSSFGDDRLFLEKFIVNPRHIEIQVLGDRHGNIIHLGERECSVQRRNQKVLEEAPSLFLDAATRERMGAEAVALARAVAYDSAGTVEFVVGQDRSFYFLEMNTRLQVEHPVTELITGLDLVEEMILVAAGDRLRYRQQDIRFDGWAIESRICAEQPERGFLPSGGKIDVFQPPEEASWPNVLRVDSGVREGDVVTSYYDPLIAKLITHGATRAEAIETQARALDAFAVQGVGTNIGFLSHLMRHPRWREGHISTSLIAEVYGDRFEPLPPQSGVLEVYAAVAVAVELTRKTRWMTVGEAQSLPQSLAVFLEGQQFNCTALVEQGDILVGQSGETIRVAGQWHPGDPVWRGRVGSRELTLQIAIAPSGITLSHIGWTCQAQVLTRRQAELMPRLPQRKKTTSEGHLLSPMLGLLVRWFVSVGDVFSKGDPICVVEAMKMEMTLRAEAGGVVRSLDVAPGIAVVAYDVLMRFSRAEA